MEKPKKVDQRYISEPTVGTDQEQFEDVARAQAAAWKKPDTAELIRDNFAPRRVEDVEESNSWHGAKLGSTEKAIACGLMGGGNPRVKIVK